MAIATAQLIVWLLTTYAATGAVVAILFLLFGLERVLPETAGAYAVRPLLIPGIILLWPLVAWRWASAIRHQPQP